MIAATILLDGHLALGALLSVGRDPVRCFAIIVTLLLPALQ